VPAILAGSLMLGAYKLFRIRMAYKVSASKTSRGTQRAALHVKHGPHAGKSIALNKFPIRIGRDPQKSGVTRKTIFASTILMLSTTMPKFIRKGTVTTSELWVAAHLSMVIQ